MKKRPRPILRGLRVASRGFDRWVTQLRKSRRLTRAQATATVVRLVRDQLDKKGLLS